MRTGDQSDEANGPTNVSHIQRDSSWNRSLHSTTKTPPLSWQQGGVGRHERVISDEQGAAHIDKRSQTLIYKMIEFRKTRGGSCTLARKIKKIAKVLNVCNKREQHKVSTQTQKRWVLLKELMNRALLFLLKHMLKLLTLKNI